MAEKSKHQELVERYGFRYKARLHWNSGRVDAHEVIKADRGVENYRMVVDLKGYGHVRVYVQQNKIPIRSNWVGGIDAPLERLKHALEMFRKLDKREAVQLLIEEREQNLISAQRSVELAKIKLQDACDLIERECV